MNFQYREMEETDFWHLSEKKTYESVVVTLGSCMGMIEAPRTWIFILSIGKSNVV